MADSSPATALPSLPPDLERRLHNELDSLQLTLEALHNATRAGLQVQHLVNRCTGCRADLQRFLDVYYPNRTVGGQPLPVINPLK